MRTIILATAALLAACSTNPQANIAGTEIALTAAEKAATTYATLPTCGRVTVCSTPSVVNQIKAADNVAYGAMKVARASGTSTDVAAANAAIAVLVALIPAATTAN